MRCLGQERSCSSVRRSTVQGMGSQTKDRADLDNDKFLPRFFPMPRIWRSFAVLRRTSLAVLAQRLRQAQDDKWAGVKLGWKISVTFIH
jgi:hypothetical protein